MATNDTEVVKSWSNAELIINDQYRPPLAILKDLLNAIVVCYTWVFCHSWSSASFSSNDLECLSFLVSIRVNELNFKSDSREMAILRKGIFAIILMNQIWILHLFHFDFSFFFKFRRVFGLNPLANLADPIFIKRHLSSLNSQSSIWKASSSVNLFIPEFDESYANQ
jgi:hypothetical protein